MANIENSTNGYKRLGQESQPCSHAKVCNSRQPGKDAFAAIHGRFHGPALPCHDSQTKQRSKQRCDERRRRIRRRDEPAGTRGGRVVDEAGATNGVDLERGIFVRRRDLLRAVRRGGVENGHGLGRAVVARGRRAAGKWQTEGH